MPRLNIKLFPILMSDQNCMYVQGFLIKWMVKDFFNYVVQSHARKYYNIHKPNYGLRNIRHKIVNTFNKIQLFFCPLL